MSDSGHELDRDNEIRRILGLVEQGVISPSDADTLLAALLDPDPIDAHRVTGPDRPGRPASSKPPSPPSRPSAPQSPKSPLSPILRLSTNPDRRGRIELQIGDNDLSLELRRLSRQARRMAHEARRIAKRDLKDAAREAKAEIERAFRLTVSESRRAAREVEDELRRVFGESHGEGKPASSWLANLAGLDYNRDRIEHSVDVSLRQPVDGARRLIVRSTSGDVTVKGWSEDWVEVGGRKVAWGMDREMAQDRADAMPVEVHRGNGDIIVEARSPAPGAVGVLNLQRMRTDLVIKAPADLGLTVVTRSGDVVVDSQQGEIDITTSSGDVVLHSTSAAVDAETATGDIRLRDCTATRLSLTSLSGDLTVDLTPQPDGEYRLRSARGDVVTGLNGGHPTAVILETASGEISSGRSLAVLRREPQRLEGRFPAPSVEQSQADGDAPADPQQQQSDQVVGRKANLRVVTISGDISVS